MYGVWLHPRELDSPLTCKLAKLVPWWFNEPLHAISGNNVGVDSLSKCSRSMQSAISRSHHTTPTPLACVHLSWVLDNLFLSGHCIVSMPVPLYCKKNLLHSHTFLSCTVQGISELLRCYICMERLTDASVCPNCSKLGCYACIRVRVSIHESVGGGEVNTGF